MGMNRDNGGGAKNVLSDTQALVQSAPRFAQLTKRHDIARVASAIAITGIQLASKIANDPNAGQQQATTQLYRPLLNDAKTSLRNGDIDSAWMSIQALEREMLALLTPAELDARWISARNEAGDSKVAGWRAKAAAKLEHLGQNPDKSIAALSEALFHIHAAAQNSYNKINRTHTQITWSALSVTILVLATVTLNDMGFFGLLLGPRVQQILPLAVFSGLLGGVLSVAYTVARADSGRKIPEVRASSAVTMVRPVIGAAVALPVMFFLESGLIIDEAHNWVVLGLCFVGGFSEQWFLGIVEKIESST